MKKYILLAALFCGLFAVSCKKESKPALNGEVTLSSQILGSSVYYTYGFSFVAAKLQKYPGEQVDLILAVVQPQDSITASFFTSTDYDGTFNNSYFNANLDSATAWYNSYTEATASSFNAITDTIKPGQVITYKSAAGKYAKFLVESYILVKPQSGNQYATAKIKWAYQPDGTNKF